MGPQGTRGKVADWLVNLRARRQWINTPSVVWNFVVHPLAMSDDEKRHSADHSTVAVDDQPQPKRKWFGGSKANNSDEKVKDTDKAADAAPAIAPVGFTELFRFSTPFELTLDAIGLVAAAAAGAAQPLMSLLFGRLTQDFVDFTIAISKGQGVESARRAFEKNAANNALYLVIIGIGMFICTFVYMYFWIYTGEVNSKRIRERYLQAVLRQDIAYFDNLGAGEVATRIQTDTHLVQQGMSEKVPLIVSYLGAFFTGFILAYIRSWRLALAISSILPCIAITGAIMNKFVSTYMQLSLQAVSAGGGSLAEEVISTVRTAHAFGTQMTLAKRYDDYINKAYMYDNKAAIVQGCGLGVFFFVIYGAYGLAFNFGTTLILQGHAQPGTVVNVFIAILIGSFSLAMLAPEQQAVSHARGAAAKLFQTIDRVPTIDSLSDAGLKPEKPGPGKIELRNVKFDYPSRPDVRILKDLTLTFEAGKTAALVGASGSGKSTIIALIERFYDPLSGSVLLDGVNLKDLNVRWLRSQIGLVSQEPTLFATTIEENVAHGLVGGKYDHIIRGCERGEEEALKERRRLVIEACERANAKDFIERLPDAWKTMVGERGFLLSGGQKQRIAIARAIVSDPKVLLLDEATSALDTQSEGIVQNALDKAAAGRTTITIAHRLSTIKDADQIYVMGDGMVLEQGTHNELLRNANGAYASLVEAQKLREEESKEQAAQRSDSEIDDDDVKTSPTDPSSEKAGVPVEDMEPLKRTATGNRSLASEILSAREKEGGKRYGNKDHSFTYLFKRMGLINRDSWNLYIWGCLAAIVTGMVYPVMGIVYAQAIVGFSGTDRAAVRRSGDRNALWFFIIAIVSAIAIAIQNLVFGMTASRLTSKLRTLSFRAILRQDIGWFDEDKHSTGVLTSTLSDNPQKVNGLAGVTLGAIVQSIACLIGGSVIGLVYGWKLALVAIACIPLVVSAGYIRLRVVVLKDQSNKEAHEESAQVACEAAGSIKTVASLTREKDCCDNYSRSLEGPLKRSNRTALYSNAFYALSQSMTFFVIALVFWYGSKLVGSQEYSTTAFFICLMSTTFGSIQAGNVFMFVPDMSSAKGAANDIINLLDSIPEIDAESTEGKPMPNATGRIVLEDIHFRYPTRPGVRVLRNLNLVVEPGTYIALVGASGSGKSTVIQLIERFYDPLAGKVTLDGQDISQLNVQEYRKHIALVSQEPTLYSGTIKFNILLGANKPHDQVTQAEIEQACRDANILDFISGLPQGFDTEVGGKGSQLSGGQKQRIAIARALLRNPKVLLLDEATSALDSTSEKVVQAALDNAAKGRTTIAIAHRLSTIQNADRIYYIKDGKVAEAGTHDELLALRGGYFELVQLQGLSATN
ncbi:Leptomycin B resistance protein pmd1 OS=Schizosaccharomyces pombe (strain 972 / ATCC 24843) GN=pmd1 PE=3 SV=2 [Rhizoctonia solani AG-1 IB]|uniref:Leptomycin B resistance protein pmd1 n=1 Tax=Thanatephorus cucumeris (strain AG1-IB / isolate 7/3/14) TaxID=1108050 RepID=M5BQ12_THACB|nr:Leptomycin B resistance protein pmd1 [Rhizoctonia solani AG-1 IB]CEL62503.1 Leptomycin B resistance protein pmd1 OS=Schizosaccharomyces pombe (strain 972 / ATCC 24843) GN=pmd1 PE=3 SV=2 [Rhizoctonia solani AG-1 IB]